jgi:hypothetical protein
LSYPSPQWSGWKALKDKTEAASYAEVIRNSLRLYEALIGEAESGNEVLIKSRDGTEKVYRKIF